MGRQPFLIRQALGRSAYEPLEPNHLPEDGALLEGNDANSVDAEAQGAQRVQLYDERGRPRNPRARASTRALIRAGNEVMEAEGFITKRRQGESLAAQQRAKDESQTGVKISIGSSALNCLLSWYPSAIRNQVQVFQPVSGLELPSLVEAHRYRFGTLGLHFCGLPARIVSHAGEFAYDRAVGVLEQKVSVLGPHTCRQHVFQKNPLSLHWTYFLRSLVAFGICVYPLRALSHLQSLGLLASSVSVTPRAVDIHALLPVSKSFLGHLGFSADPNSSEVWIRLGHLVTSPFCLLWLDFILRRYIEGQIMQLVTRILPKPDNADNLSKWACRPDHLEQNYITGFEWVEPIHSLESFKYYWRKAVSWASPVLDQIVTVLPISEEAEPFADTTLTEIDDSAVINLSTRTSAPAFTTNSNDSGTGREASRLETGQALTLTLDGEVQPRSPRIVPRTGQILLETEVVPGELESSAVSDVTVALEPVEVEAIVQDSANVENNASVPVDQTIVRESFGVEVVIQESINNEDDAEAPVVSLDNIYIQQPAEQDDMTSVVSSHLSFEPEVHHRVTVLSSNSTMILAHAIAGFATNIILAPLESLALQSLVRTTIDCSRAYSVPLVDPTYLLDLGLNAVDFDNYSGNLSGLARLGLTGAATAQAESSMSLWKSYTRCIAVDIICRLMVFGLSTRLSIFVGRRFYDWGKLQR